MQEYSATSARGGTLTMHARPGAGACCCGAAVDSCQGKNLNRSIWRTERGSTTRVTPYTPDMGYRAARHTHLPASAAHLPAGDQAHAVIIACRALPKDQAASSRGVPPVDYTARAPQLSPSKVSIACFVDKECANMRKQQRGRERHASRMHLHAHTHTYLASTVRAGVDVN